MSESNEKKIHISATNGSSSSDNGGRMAGEVFDLEVPGHVPDPQGNYKKGMNSRHVQILAFGGTIGAGLFISTGKSLRDAGPGNMIIGYGMVMTQVLAVLMCLAELVVAFPTSGKFVDYTNRFIGGGEAFGIAIADWLAWTSTIGYEASAFSGLVAFWSDKVPEAALITIFLFFTCAVHLFPVRVFGEVEFVTCVARILVLSIFLITSCVVINGDAPNGLKLTGQYWHVGPAFNHAFKGFITCAAFGCSAIGDQVIVGIMVAEAKNPAFVMPRAVKLTFFRCTFVYMLTIIFITIMVPANSKDLFSASSMGSSPLVIAFQRAGIKVLPSILDGVMIAGLLAIAIESLYISSRVLREMGRLGFAPKFFTHVDRRGRPTWAILFTGVIGIIFAYLNLSAAGTTVFVWFADVASTAWFFVWVLLGITTLRFHRAVSLQQSDVLSTSWAYRMPLYPLAPIWLITTSVMSLGGMFYLGLFPIGASPSANAFFQEYIGVVVVVFFALVYKCYFRTNFTDLRTADLVTGRLIPEPEDLKFIEHYRTLPLWRRFISYFSGS